MAAVERLKSEGLLRPEAIFAMEEEKLALIIRSAGYYNVKARRLKAFVRFLFDHHRGNLEEMFVGDLWSLRKSLLRINGIGEETADNILLYAGKKPVFVVDVYTRRILSRHGVCPEGLAYGEIQNLFLIHLPTEAALYNQYHALLVNAGKNFCGKRPKCDPCPLRPLYEKASTAFPEQD